MDLLDMKAFQVRLEFFFINKRILAEFLLLL